jgi:hypothetical protein
MVAGEYRPSGLLARSGAESPPSLFTLWQKTHFWLLNTSAPSFVLAGIVAA